ncbi:MAG: lamin tail domain-containing protein [Flavobacteriales bacterium]|nr:lamin tail domain-containing protein [Flavobacteriales bacterium]
MKVVFCYALAALFMVGCFNESQAQVTETFSDGDFTQNPEWIGDTGDFEVNPSFQLRLVSTGTDTSFLATENTYSGETEWNFWFRLSFAPSDNNNVRIYLMSNQSDLKGSLNGYYLRYGENGSADGLDLWRQNGNTLTKIIDGTPSPNAALTNQLVRVKVIRSAIGEWQLFADYTGGYFYQLLGSVTDNTYSTPSYLGVWCRYTTTNASGFYFDDIYTGPILIDTTPPEVLSVSVISNDSLEVLFSEPITQASASVTANYSIDGGIGNPLDAVYSVSAPDKVILVLGSTLTSEQIYTLQVTSVQDLSANTMLPFTGQFSYYVPQPRDVIINEIMADPTPVVGLPEVEYVELHNRKPSPIDITGWKIQVGTTVRTLPSSFIPADSFIVLTVNPAPVEFSSINGVGVPSFPSLTNAGANIQLLTAQDVLMDEVTYDLSWYRDVVKDDGGWSLERIRTNDFCNGGLNWNASQNPAGGTPGTQNSVFETSILPFSVLSVTVVGANELEVLFSQFPDPQSLQPSGFSVSPSLGNPDSVIYTSGNSCRLVFGTFFTEFLEYQLTVSSSVSNCVGQNLPVSTPAFSFIYSLPRQNDVIISEIMADETPSQGLPLHEYVELFNRTANPVNLTGWSFQSGNNSVVLPVFVLQPGAYVTLTKSGGELLFPNQVLGIASFPTLTNSSGTLVLRNANADLIHSVSYSDSWIRESFKRDGGWSMEMIDTDNPCTGKANWTASVHPDGGTPGGVNSVKASNPDFIQPIPMRLGIPENDKLTVFFSEPLRYTSVSTDRFFISNGIGNPIALEVEQPFLHTVTLTFAQSILPDTEYMLQYSDSITDCAGNTTEIKTNLFFRLPVQAGPGDVIVNEVLFDPKGNGQDFIEFYNRSEHALDMSKMYFGLYDSLLKQLTDVKTISSRSALIMPGSYLVLSTDMEDIFYNYFTQDRTAFWNVPSLPSMSNSGASIGITNEDLVVLDGFTFTDQFHFSLISNKDGVSLERINLNGPTQSRYNWTSASASVGFATPGYKNSQSGMPAEQDDVITLSPEVFSPDQDGVDDVLFITYEFEEPGNVITIRIFDEAGRLMKNLVQNEFCGTQGQYVWDGATENGIRSKIGIYIVVAEWYNAQGGKGRAKKAVVLAKRL